MRPRVIGLATTTAVAAAATILLIASRDELPVKAILECRRPQVVSPPAVAERPEIPVRATTVAAVDEAIAMAPLPDGVNALLLTRPGKVLRLDLASGATEELLDLVGRVGTGGGEGGLLAVAVHPDAGSAYLHFTDMEGTSRIVEHRLEGAAIVAGTERELLSVSHAEKLHNGGAMHFGPDGALYLGFGNGGNSTHDIDRGADPGHLDGKLLRIHPRPAGDQPYTVPKDNPFAGQRGVRPEIWAVGLRNPWQFSFDRATGELWIGDVGAACYEEIDVVPAATGGADLGFPRFEGFHAFLGDEADDSTFPVYAYRHVEGACAVVGGVVYRGSRIPALDAAYLLADYCDDRVRWLRRRAGGVEVGLLTARVPLVQSFAQGGDGEVYVLSATAGVIRLDAP